VTVTAGTHPGSRERNTDRCLPSVIRPETSSDWQRAAPLLVKIDGQGSLTRAHRSSSATMSIAMAPSSRAACAAAAHSFASFQNLRRVLNAIWILYCVVTGSTLSDSTTQPVNEFIRKDWCEAQLIGRNKYCTSNADGPIYPPDRPTDEEIYLEWVII
jgi:hypothetical protein